MSPDTNQWQAVARSNAAGRSKSIRYANGPAKRAFDLLAGLLMTVLTAPITVLLAAGSAVSFRAWPLFVQPRLGRDGRLFCFIKIRSLPPSAPASADKYTVAEINTTRWGSFLRTSHLDELPQFWLMVTGRMSLIGPRPEMPALAATFDSAFVRERMTVRPGITGPWQVSTASAGLIGEGPELDRFYLAHAGIRVDMWVSLRTLGGLVGLKLLPLECFPKWAGQMSPTVAPTLRIEVSMQTEFNSRQTELSS
jgi:lipopolysaccharide/colanic/teichoic acid biosynthesis glycosyltransferase